MSTAPAAAAGAMGVSHHRLHEDVQALTTGTLFVALGVVMFGHAGLLTGGTAGIAFLIHYATGLSFSLAFFMVNLPFYFFAWRRIFRPVQACKPGEVCAIPQVRATYQLIFWVVAVLVLVALGLPYVMPFFY